MVIGAETPQLYLLRIGDLLCVAVAPFHGHFRVRISVDEDVECILSIQDREKGDRGNNLTEYSLDLFLDLFFRLLCGVGGRVSGPLNGMVSQVLV